MRTLRITAPRKSLSFTIISRTRLLAAPESIRGKLQLVFANDQALEDPYLTVIEIKNSSRSPIPSDAFDDKRGLVLSLGADVTEILNIERSPSSAPAPNIVGSGRFVELQPELIAAGEIIRASVLTKGRVDRIELTLNPLREKYNTSTKDRELWEQQQNKRAKLATSVLGAFLVAEVALIAIALVHDLNSTTRRLNAAIFNTRANACNAVDQSSLDVTSLAENQISQVIGMENFKTGGKLLVFNKSFKASTENLETQIDFFTGNISSAGVAGVSTKKTKSVIEDAERLEVALTELAKSTTIVQQTRELGAAENSSLAVSIGVGNIFKDCHPYL